jgi:uncharacterized damage-inducible protein DinB
MSEIVRITEQLRRIHEGDAWHGPSVREALQKVSAARAAAKPIPSAHSIWEITLHITSWDDAVRRWLAGQNFASSEINDWPRVQGTSEADWAETIARLEAGQRELRAVVAAIDESKLLSIPPGRTTTPYELMLGIIQHATYHAGQISLLRKGEA